MSANKPPDLYKPFSDITRASLNHALAESSETLSKTDTDSLMQAYDSLGTFPDVESALTAIADDPSIDAYVFSNGTDRMVSTSVKQSPSLSPHAKIFKDLITIEEICVFKPDPRVYQHLAKKVGKTTNQEDMSSVWLVSGNPFDVVGARAAGYQAAWVDRAGHHGKGGWNDRLGELLANPPLEPTVIVKGVDEAVSAIKRWTAEHVFRTRMDASGAGYNKVSTAMGPG
jgi:2-haloacid dehalogenase